MKTATSFKKNTNKIKYGYIKFSNSEFSVKSYDRDKIYKSDTLAFAKINKMISDDKFKNKVYSLRKSFNIKVGITEYKIETIDCYSEEYLDINNYDLFQEEVKVLIAENGFTQDWYPTFERLIVLNELTDFYSGSMIRKLKDSEINVDNLDKRVATAFLINNNLTINEIIDFLSKNGFKTKSNVKIPLEKDVKIEQMIINSHNSGNSDVNVGNEVEKYMANRHENKKRRRTSLSNHTEGYVRKQKSRLRKKLINE